MSLVKLVLSAIAALIAFLGLFCLLASLLDRPTIYTSYSTKQCAFIQNADGTKDSCSVFDPDQKYYHGWAQ